MKKLVLLLCCLISLCCGVEAIDLGGLESIGPVSTYTSTSSGVVFTCSDGSQVQVLVLAPDLVRVRASYRKPLPQRDHSWAIAKTDWVNPDWKVAQAPDSFVITTSELHVVVRRSPLLVEFRDAKTGKTINADARPMMFDPKSTTIAAAKKLGFEEHFYGLGEKAARLDKRSGHFTMWNSDTPAYQEGTDPIYQSIPFYIGCQGGDGYGIFLDNNYLLNYD